MPFRLLVIFLKYFVPFGISGVSPQHADEFNDEEKTKIESELKLFECRSIGPIGLDYKLTNITKEQQMLAFEEQVCSIYMYIAISGPYNAFGIWRIIGS